MPTWADDAGSLVAEQATVWGDCNGGCGNSRVDLEAVIERHGPRFSFWNRTQPCRNQGCTGRVSFRAIRPGGSWQILLYGATPSAAEHLHQKWRASLPADVRDRLPLAPMLAATQGRLALACAACALEPFEVDAIQVTAFGPRFTIDDVISRMQQQCERGRRCGIAVELLPAPASGTSASKAR